ncbi:hypothetical protein GCM10022222_25990 [Amycolatopsis ultiminotia]|uniref:Uncharacterized protein n=1 Tax=Amycolatopsis ultiminotia TaxID=543629 RepID=A0ABP6VWZ5_9PSEU
MQVSDPAVKRPVQRWLQVGIPVATGVLVVVLAWLVGPGLFGIGADVAGAPVEAQVTKPAACSVTGAVETVQFPLGGKTRTGTLDGCGHGKDEHVQVVVPDNVPADGTVAVTASDTSSGSQDARAPIALALLLFSCFCGGMYAYLVIRGSGRPALLS